MFKTRAWTRQQCWVPALAARCFTGFLLPGVCTAACPASQAGPQGCPVQGCPRNAAGPSFSLLFLYSVLGIPSTSFKQITLFFFSPSLSIMFSVDWGDFWFVFLVNFLERCSILLLFSPSGYCSQFTVGGGGGGELRLKLMTWPQAGLAEEGGGRWPWSPLLRSPSLPASPSRSFPAQLTPGRSLEPPFLAHCLSFFLFLCLVCL